MADLFRPVLGFAGAIRWLYFVHGPALVTGHPTNFCGDDASGDDSANCKASSIGTVN
jgi:hypothetical protein